MTNEIELKAIAEKLLQKTRKREVNWIEKPSPNARNSYSVQLASADILLQYVVPLVEPDCLVLSILDNKGRAVMSWSVDEPEPDVFSNDADWKLLQSLFHEAKQQATGWDSALKEVVTSLESEGTIGLTSTRK